MSIEEMQKQERQQKDDKLNRVALGVATGCALALGATTANAAEGGSAVVDTSGIVSDINATKPEMVNVGTAMIGLVIVAVLFMMVRRVLR